MTLKKPIEKLVLREVDRHMATSAQCSCQRCREDAAALALRDLPNRYASTQRGEVMINVELQSLQVQLDVHLQGLLPVRWWPNVPGMSQRIWHLHKPTQWVSPGILVTARRQAVQNRTASATGKEGLLCHRLASSILWVRSWWVRPVPIRLERLVWVMPVGKFWLNL